MRGVLLARSVKKSQPALATQAIRQLMVLNSGYWPDWTIDHSRKYHDNVP